MKEFDEVDERVIYKLKYQVAEAHKRYSPWPVSAPDDDDVVRFTPTCL